MEKNRNKKQNNLVIYIFSAVMLVTILVVGVISAVGTANHTDAKIGIGTEDDSVTDVKQTKSRDTGKSSTNVRDTAEPKETGSKDTEPSQPKETEKITDTSPASAPLEFCLPVTGYISKDYSMDMPVFSLTMNDYRTHSGLDIQASVGAAVASVADGEVTNRYTDPFMGVCVEVTHGGGLVSRYMNMSAEYPKDTEVGAKVYCGQSIGSVGDSASAEAADSSHLHFELLQNGKNVDPLDYIGYEPMADEYSE